jgi:hypothetical protein
MLKFIGKYKKYDPNMPQFLVTHITDPTRLFFRIFSKNLPKMRKICRFLSDKGITKKTPEWVISADFLTGVIDTFVDDLSKHLVMLYDKEGMDAVQKFMDGVELNRISSNYSRTSMEGLEMAVRLFAPLYHIVGSNLGRMDGIDKHSVVKNLKFMESKDMFDK